MGGNFPQPSFQRAEFGQQSCGKPQQLKHRYGTNVPCGLPQTGGSGFGNGEAEGAGEAVGGGEADVALAGEEAGDDDLRDAGFLADLIDGFGR
jgi:hypothetical protein